LAEGQGLEQEALCVHVAHRRHTQLDTHVKVTTQVSVWGAKPVNKTQPFVLHS